MEKWIVPGVLVAAVLGGVALLSPAGGDRGTHSGSADAALLSALAEEIAQLRQEQLQLEARLQELQLAPALPVASAAEAPRQEEIEGEDAEEAAPPEARPRSEQRIANAGLTPEEFAVMDDRAQALYRQNFEREWLARRERYLASDQNPDARQVLRQELGDDAYDRYLFASGQSNRVRVRRVIPGTAAELAGIQEGDILLRYDTERLFGFDDLRRASYDGAPGDAVIVEVRRADGSIEQLSLQRGPLGISSSGGWRETPGG